MEETEILTQITAGDTEKFGLLYDIYFARIYNYIFYRTRERETAEDITSATFFKAVRSLHTFNAHKGTFSSWLYRIARNTLYDHWRGGTRPESIDDHEDVLIAPGDLEHETFDRELVRKVNDCVARLPKAQQEIIKMRIWDDLPYAQIAEILGKSEASCKMEFSRAIRKLKDIAPLAAMVVLIMGSVK
ncbi:MAG: RNA polymerase sigma factor [Candidatus Pacebacteria bacterium]|nr:RNA polymerase sigma factor [Candidatus Paceibacterota bacterium]